MPRSFVGTEGWQTVRRKSALLRRLTTDLGEPKTKKLKNRPSMIKTQEGRELPQPDK